MSGDSNAAYLLKHLRKNAKRANDLKYPSQYNPSGCFSAPSSSPNYGSADPGSSAFYKAKSYSDMPVLTGNAAEPVTANGRAAEVQKAKQERPRISDLIQFDMNGLNWKILYSGPYRDVPNPEAVDYSKVMKPKPGDIYQINQDRIWVPITKVDADILIANYKKLESKSSQQPQFRQTASHPQAATGAPHTASAAAAYTGAHRTASAAAAYTGSPHAPSATTGAPASAMTGSHASAMTGSHAAAMTGGYRNHSSAPLKAMTGSAHAHATAAMTGCMRGPNDGSFDANGNCVSYGSNCDPPAYLDSGTRCYQCPDGGRCDSNGQCTNCGSNCDMPEYRQGGGGSGSSSKVKPWYEPYR